jgi:hypothetical protein
LDKGYYFELRCAVAEMFYEVLLAEHYTVGQAAARCLVEFRQDLNRGGRDALVVLSVLLARAARHDAKALAGFASEIATLRTLAKKSSCWKGLGAEAGARLKEDVRFALEKA